LSAHFDIPRKPIVENDVSSNWAFETSVHSEEVDL